MALDDQGRVWVWGRGDSGQLGLSSSTSLSVPTLLSLPAPCLQISAGGSFSLARTNEKGDNIYGWGYGEMGQLANGCEDAMVPFRMNLKSRVVLGISAGGQHSVLLLNFKS
jgi:regulator of chromosome condensation